MANPSLRTQVVQALVDAFSAIVAGADYHYTPAKVWRWRVPQSGEMSYPSIGVFDLDESVEYHAPPCVDRRVSVTVQGIHAALPDQEPDVVARNLMADIQRAALADVRLGLPEFVIDVTETANRLAVDAPTEPYVVVEVDLDVHYRTSLKDPAARR